MLERTAGVADYFVRHLGASLGAELLPGLRHLTTSFTLTVGADGPWSVAIAAGRLVRSERADAPDSACHLVVGADDFARVVAGRCTPQSLFVTRRLAVRGNPLHALRAAAAMEQFFRLRPYPAEEAR